jgi:uridylate kinase
LAVRLRAARFVNATRVGALYDHDPELHPNAVRLPKLSWDEFRAIVHRDATGKAGQRFLFDRLGADLLHRAQIPLEIVDGRDLAELSAALEGRPLRGTHVE